MLLIYLSCAWILGILLGSRFGLAPAWIAVGLSPLPLVFILRRFTKKIIIASLCAVIFLSGIVYFQSNQPSADTNSISNYNDTGSIQIRGVLDRAPEPGNKTIHLHVSAREIQVDGEWQETSGTVLLYVPRFPAYSYGDSLRITGRLETPPRFDDFDYQAYLARKEIFSTMLYPEIIVLDTGQGFKPLEWIYSLRTSLAGAISEVLPEPQASLTQGILLGLRGNIPQEVRENFARTGTAHLLAISGLHLSIVAGILLAFGVWLFGKRHYTYVWLALGGIWFYALLTGMQPPVLRAVIMASTFLVAELLGRQRSAITALAFAAAVMVAITPGILWSASFQMSFMAMTGLIFAFPPLQRLLRRGVTKLFGEEGRLAGAAGFITDSLSVSLAALTAVWPLIAYYFGIFSPIGPLATLFALPALPGIISAGALAGLLGLIALPIGQVVGWLDWLFASYLIQVVNIFDAVPAIEPGRFDVSLVLIYYAFVGLGLWFLSKKTGLSEIMPRMESLVSGLSGKLIITALAIIAILVSTFAVTLPDNNLHVSFLDVGEGDSILIQKGNRQILIDGGPDSKEVTLALGKEMPFWDRTIDLVILTHPHADHLTGLIEVLNRYEVGQVLVPPTGYESSAYGEWLKLLNEKDIEHLFARTRQQIKLDDGAVIEVLNPPLPLLTGTESDTDNNAIVLRLNTGEISFLFTSDLMWQGEYELIARRAGLTGTILKVAHHGSSTSTTSEFLSVVNPHLAVISVGEDNTYGHPTDKVITRLSEKLGEEYIYRTDELGTIEFITDGDRLWVKVGK